MQLVGGLVTAVLALGVLFWLNWHLTAAILGVLVLFAGMLSYAFKRLRPIFRERNKIQAEITGRLAESLGGVRVVKAYTAETFEEEVFGGGIDKLFGNIRSTMSGIAGVTSASTALLGVVGVIMMVVGGRSILAGSMTLGDFVMYIFFSGLLVAPVAEIAAIGTQLTEAFAGLDRIREIFGKTTEDDEDAARHPVEKLRGEVEFEDVWFEYQPDTPVLRGVSFRSPAGSTTALVGSSGSGKSTLIGLVMAFPPSDPRPHPRRRRRISRSCACATIAGTSGRSSRTTSSSTARSPRTSPTPGRTPPATTCSRRRRSPTATSS